MLQWAPLLETKVHILVEVPGLPYILIVCNIDTFKQSRFKIGIGRKSQKNKVSKNTSYKEQLDKMQTLFIKLIINSFTVSASYHKPFRNKGLLTKNSLLKAQHIPISTLQFEKKNKPFIQFYLSDDCFNIKQTIILWVATVMLKRR